MKYHEVLTADLIPYARNARTHSEAQIEKIAKSIKKFKFLNPVIVDGKKGIVAGHGRVLAAQKLGLDKVPCIIADHLTDAEKRAYVLADNRLALDAGWDDDLLKIELSELSALDFDLSFTGFDVHEVDGFVRANRGADEAEDDVPEAPVIPVSKMGDVWLCGDHRVMCGDSTDPEKIKVLMGETLADIVITDPPYNVAYEGKTKAALKIKNDEMNDNDFYLFLLKAHQSMFNFSAKGAPIYVFHADSEGLNFRRALIDAGFKLAQCCIWVKQTMVMGRQDYHWKHEPVLYGWKEGAAHTWASDRKQTTVWNFDRPMRNDVHPTMKPVELICYPMENSSHKGACVFDPFGGSGTTMIAAEKTGRKALLMELDSAYVDVIVRRWQDFTGKQATRESDGVLFDALVSAQEAA